MRIDHLAPFIGGVNFGADPCEAVQPLIVIIRAVPVAAHAGVFPPPFLRALLIFIVPHAFLFVSRTKSISHLASDARDVC